MISAPTQPVGWTVAVYSDTPIWSAISLHNRVHRDKVCRYAYLIEIEFTDGTTRRLHKRWHERLADAQRHYRENKTSEPKRNTCDCCSLISLYTAKYHPSSNPSLAGPRSTLGAEPKRYAAISLAVPSDYRGNKPGIVWPRPFREMAFITGQCSCLS